MDRVRIRIFLAGSHEHAWTCAADHDSIRVLMDALSANAHPSHHRASNLVRLVVPTDSGGERAIVFLRQSLVAVETDPPLIDELPTLHTARQAYSQGKAAATGVERPAFMVIPEFFPVEVRDQLFAWLVAQESDFQASGVRSSSAAADDDYDFRKSSVSMNFGPWREVVQERLQLVLPHLCTRLGFARPERERIELQITHHGHLDRFKAHTDNATGQMRQRLISLVYYLHRQPRPFKGGELVLYDRVTNADGTTHQGEGFRVVQPDDNTLVAFPSHFHHQVRTIRCPEGGFADGRFTVNGWLRDLDRGGED